MAGRADGQVAESYGFLIPVSVHFDELDSFGMLYNSRYGVLVERAWVAYWQRREIAFTKDWTALGDAFNVVKDFRITFEAPIERPVSTASTSGWNTSGAPHSRTASASALRTAARRRTHTVYAP